MDCGVDLLRLSLNSSLHDGDRQGHATAEPPGGRGPGTGRFLGTREGAVSIPLRGRGTKPLLELCRTSWPPDRPERPAPIGIKLDKRRT